MIRDKYNQEEVYYTEDMVFITDFQKGGGGDDA